MGKGRAGGISGTLGANPQPSVRDNIPALRKEFPMTESGWFGSKSDEHNSKARIVERNEPLAAAERFFELASEGASVEEIESGKRKAQFPDGTVVMLREKSSSGGPAVDINNRGGGRPKTQKIHFEREETK